MFAVTWEHYRFSLLKVKRWWQCGLRSLFVESNNICKIFESNNIWNILKAIIWALKIWKCTQLQCNSINKTQFKIDKHKNSEARSSIFLLIWFRCLYMNLNMDTLFTVLKGVKRHFFDVDTAEHSTSDCLYLGFAFIAQWSSNCFVLPWVLESHL